MGWCCRREKVRGNTSTLTVSYAQRMGVFITLLYCRWLSASSILSDKSVKQGKISYNSNEEIAHFEIWESTVGHSHATSKTAAPSGPPGTSESRYAVRGANTGYKSREISAEVWGKVICKATGSCGPLETFNYLQEAYKDSPCVKLPSEQQIENR